MSLTAPLYTIHLDTETRKFVAMSSIGNGDEPREIERAETMAELLEALRLWDGFNGWKTTY